MLPPNSYQIWRLQGDHQYKVQAKGAKEGAETAKEEKDVIIASGFDIKEFMPHVSEAAKKFWFETLSNLN